MVKVIDVLLFNGESNVPCVRHSDYAALESEYAYFKVAAEKLRDSQIARIDAIETRDNQWSVLLGMEQSRAAALEAKCRELAGQVKHGDEEIEEFMRQKSVGWNAEANDARNIVLLIDERMGKGWTRDLAHALFPSSPCFAKETP